MPGGCDRRIYDSAHFLGPPLEIEAEFAKEINRRSEVIDDDSYVVHPFERHVSNLQSVVESNNGLFLQRRTTTRRGA